MKKILINGILGAVLALALGSSTRAEDAMQEMEGTHADEKPVAFALLKGTAEGSVIEGKIKFHAMEGGLMVSGKIKGLEGAGKRAIHVHENGSCDDMGNAAGGHFNPHGAEHGYLPEDGIHGAHVGDMGNIEVDEAGVGKLMVHMTGLNLEGEDGILGKAVILHEKEDEFVQPTGNAGGRIACGIIVAAGEVEDEAAKEEVAGHEHHMHEDHMK